MQNASSPSSFLSKWIDQMERKYQNMKLARTSHPSYNWPKTEIRKYIRSLRRMDNSGDLCARTRAA